MMTHHEISREIHTLQIGQSTSQYKPQHDDEATVWVDRDASGYRVNIVRASSLYGGSPEVYFRGSQVFASLPEAVGAVCSV